MTYYTHKIDSLQINRLRFAFRGRVPRRQATAGRLGEYAVEVDARVTDYGAHSDRWIVAFNEGRARALKAKKINP